MIEIVLMVCSPEEDRQGKDAEQNTKQLARYGEPKGNVPA